MADEKTPALTLRLLTPTGTGGETACDSVRLCLRDNAEGKGGGMVGILRNHAPAVMALGKGPVRAVLGGETVFSAAVDGGFASVRDNVITVTTDSAVIDGAEAHAEAE